LFELIKAISIPEKKAEKISVIITISQRSIIPYILTSVTFGQKISNLNSQNLNVQNCFGHLIINIWNLFVICFLFFGAFDKIIVTLWTDTT